MTRSYEVKILRAGREPGIESFRAIINSTSRPVDTFHYTARFSHHPYPLTGAGAERGPKRTEAEAMAMLPESKSRSTGFPGAAIVRHHLFRTGTDLQTPVNPEM